MNYMACFNICIQATTTYSEEHSLVFSVQLFVVVCYQLTELSKELSLVNTVHWSLGVTKWNNCYKKRLRVIVFTAMCLFWKHPRNCFSVEGKETREREKGSKERKTFLKIPVRSATWIKFPNDQTSVCR